MAEKWTLASPEKWGKIGSENEKNGPEMEKKWPEKMVDPGSKFLRQDSEMTLPKGSVSDLPFSLKKSWELVCLRTGRSLLQTLPRRLSQNPSSDRSRS